MCLYPKLIINPKYRPSKKNNGKPPKLKDERIKYVPIGCQKCIECMKMKARQWRARLTEEIRANGTGKLVTLTFSDESLYELDTMIAETLETNNDEYDAMDESYKRDNKIATKAVRLFLERWRKEHKKSLRHWFVTELGHEGTQRLHLHGIIWTDKSNWVEQITKHWKYGWVWTGKGQQRENYVNEKTINYITKYVMKVDEIHKKYRSIILTSPGIGESYTKRWDANNNKYKEEGETIELYTPRAGGQIALPIYWRNKIYTEDQREKLWIQKIDKDIRWVCGAKIENASNNMDLYYTTLEYHRQRSKRLGYMEDDSWDQIEYENNIKKLIKQKYENEHNRQSNSMGTSISNNMDNILDK